MINGNHDSFGSMNLTGVVEVTTNFGSCSSVLVGDFTVLTAGHCVAPSFGGTPYNNPQVTFLGPTNTGPFTGGYQTIGVASAAVDPLWNGDPTLGGDLAVIQMSQPAPAYAMRYSLYSGQSIPYGSVLVLAGFGLSGTGDTGATGAFQYGFLRAGTNVYESNGANPLFVDPLHPTGFSPNLLLGQFYDPNNPSTNAYGVATPYSSGDEVNIAHGDSGGPTFFNGQVIGIHDIGDCISSSTNPNQCATPPSVSTDPNLATYGQFFGDVSVSGNAAFIDSQLVPEPGSAVLLILGLGLAGLRHQRRRTRDSRIRAVARHQ